MAELKILETKTVAGELFRRRRDPDGSALGNVHDYGNTNPSTLPYDFLLYDFDIDWDKRKPAHEARLDEVVATIMKSPSVAWDIHIDGYASTTGDPKHNEKLSNMREEEVKGYLLGKKLGTAAGAPSITYPAFFHGFAKTTKGHGEWKWGRSVRVAITRKGVPPPPPKDLPNWEVGLSDSKSGSFQIRVEGATSLGYTTPVGVLISSNAMRLIIWDTKNNLAADYLYTGLEGGLSIPGTWLPSVSYTKGGKWKFFMTTQEIKVTEFAGLAAFNGGSAVAKSFNLLAMRGLPKGVMTVPAEIPLDTGLTIGVPATASGPGRMNSVSSSYKFFG